jgi:uncharacterized protein with PIN domain
MNKKKNTEERSPQMREVSAGLQDVLGMTQWRESHRQASLREIEAAVDAQINRLRAQLIQDLVHMGEGSAQERPRCEHCGEALVARGQQTRYLQTHGGEAIKLEREYGTCPQCGQGLFPPG